MPDKHELTSKLESMRPRLLRAVEARGVPQEDGHEIVQDVLLTAVQQIQRGQYEGRSALSTWVGGVLNHKIENWWRRHYRTKLTLVPFGSAEGILSADGTGALYSIDIENQILVREVLESMPPELGTLLLLHFTEEIPVEEIARMKRMHPLKVYRALKQAKVLFIERFRGAQDVRVKKAGTGSRLR